MNQRKLDHEVKTLQVQAAQFAKQTGQWIGMVENFNQALKVGHPPSHHQAHPAPPWTASSQVISGLGVKRKWVGPRYPIYDPRVREAREKEIKAVEGSKQSPFEG